ncbi:MAG: hypothetical protein ACUVYA_00700 [Planctomycetota bacterium]
MKGTPLRADPGWGARARSGALAAGFVVLAAIPSRASDALWRGNEAFRRGEYAEAARIYESEGEAKDLFFRRFNAGVSHLRAGALQEALRRFEDVSARAEGKLRDDALYNAGLVRFDEARAAFEGARKVEDPRERARKLAEAAAAFRASAELFRRIAEPDPDAERNLALAKTALRAALDEIRKLEEEEKKKSEDAALASPPELLRSLADKERLCRAVSRAVSGEKGSAKRLAARRLRKSTEENRRLAEKLQHALEKPEEPPPGSKPDPNAPERSEEEKKRLQAAAEAVARAIEAQRDAELAYGKLDVAGASPHHSRALREFQRAREALPLDIAQVIQDALQTQEGVVEALEGLERAERGGLAPEIQGSGLGKVLAEAIRDKVLLPIAKLASPAVGSQAKALAEDEEDVVWAARIVSRAEVPASPEPAAPQAAAPGRPPVRGPEEAKKLSEALRAEGETALRASSKAFEELSAGRPSPALPPAKEALEALRRAADLLPKPPEPPEERLRKLIEEERKAKEAVEGLESLAEDLRRTAGIQIATNQRSAGREAAGIAEELEGRQDEPARRAVPKVREGEERVYASAEAILRDQREPAAEAIDRAIQAFEEALKLLSGEGPKPEPKEEEKRGGEDERKEERKEEKPEAKEENRYALTPLDAKAIQDEMDRKRREEEAKIFIPSSVTVEKDW